MVKNTVQVLAVVAALLLAGCAVTLPSSPTDGPTERSPTADSPTPTDAEDRPHPTGRVVDITLRDVNRSAVPENESVRHLDPANLSADVRAFLDRLVETGEYYEEGTIPAHVDEFVDAVGAQSYAETDTVFVEYRSEYYRITVTELY